MYDPNPNSGTQTLQAWYVMGLVMTSIQQANPKNSLDTLFCAIYTDNICSLYQLTKYWVSQKLDLIWQNLPKQHLLGFCYCISISSFILQPALTDLDQFMIIIH